MNTFAAVLYVLPELCAGSARGAAIFAAGSVDILGGMLESAPFSVIVSGGDVKFEDYAMPVW